MLGLNDPNNPNNQEDVNRKSATELLRSMNITIGVCSTWPVTIREVSKISKKVVNPQLLFFIFS